MKKKQITKLAPELEAALPAVREQWRATALRTDGIDDEKAKESVRALYSASGLTPPRLMLIAQSPMQALMMRGVLQIGTDAKLRDQLGGQLWDQLGDQLGDQLWDQLKSGNLHQDIWFAGAADGFWLAFYDYGRRAGATYDAQSNARLDAWIEYSRQCGVAFLYPDAAIICDRPRTLKFDDERRLHSETGPAIEFRDGWAVHAWRGVRVPAEWVEGKLPSAADAIRWTNMEQRRAACEMIGWHKILDELHAVSIDRDADPQVGELVEVELPDVGVERFIKVRCGTGRTFAICVTRFPYRTARECNAATYGWKPGEPIEHFIPVHRT